jgi:hypothetical protein
MIMIKVTVVAAKKKRGNGQKSIVHFIPVKAMRITLAHNTLFQGLVWTACMFVLAVAGVLLLTTSGSRIRFLLLFLSRVSRVILASAKRTHVSQVFVYY